MSNRSLVVAALLCAPFVTAQDAAQGMPDPKTPQHDALKVFAGTWNSTMKMAAMPGVPGMEEPMECKGTERGEMICDGLFLKSSVDGNFGGEPFAGMWLAGYDPFKKTYVSLWVDSNEPRAFTGTGTHDPDTGTWEFISETPHGPMRSVARFTGKDTFEEKCYAKGPDGKEVVCMDITRKRAAGGAAPVDAAASKPKPPSDQHAELHKTIGTWDATVRWRPDPGADWVEEKCTETVTAICGGKWLWSDFRGAMMGMPFEGHALIGYDGEKERCVSFWIDSMSPVPMQTTGSYDEAEKGMVLTGEGVDMTGQPVKVREVVTWKDADTRMVKMEFRGAEGTNTMEITYRRSQAKQKQ